MQFTSVIIYLKEELVVNYFEDLFIYFLYLFLFTFLDFTLIMMFILIALHLNLLVFDNITSIEEKNYTCLNKDTLFHAKYNFCTVDISTRNEAQRLRELVTLLRINGIDFHIDIEN